MKQIQIEEFERAPLSFMGKLSTISHQLKDLGYSVDFIADWASEILRRHQRLGFDVRLLTRESYTLFKPEIGYVGVLLVDFDKLKIHETAYLAENRHLA